MAKPFIALIVGVLFLVIGLVLEGTIIAQAVTSGETTGIGSFAGAGALNNLIPLVYNAVVVVAGVGLIGIGVAGAVGMGPAKASPKK